EVLAERGLAVGEDHPRGANEAVEDVAERCVGIAVVVGRAGLALRRAGPARPRVTDATERRSARDGRTTGGSLGRAHSADRRSSGRVAVGAARADLSRLTTEPRRAR